MSSWAQQNQTFVEPDSTAPLLSTENDRIELIEGSIPFLKWNEETISITHQGALSTGNVSGKLSEEVTGLKLNNFEIPVYDHGSFQIRFTFSEAEKTFTLTALTASGRVFRAKFRITAKSESEKNVTNLPVKSKKLRFTLGLGYTYLDYQQTNVPEFSENLITVKGSTSYFLVPDRWDVSLGGFFNAYDLTKSNQYQIHYLGLNAKIGYHFLTAPHSFRFNLNAGVYYNTTFSSDIGFANAFGPQLYPEFGYVFSDGRAIMFYAKYSPVYNSPNFDLKRDFEVALGASYSFSISKTNRLSFALDCARLNLVSANAESKTKTVSLSTGITF